MEPDAPPAVVPIWPGVAIPDARGAEPGVVRVLEVALERAKRGELVSVGLVGVMANDSIFREWAVGLRTRTELVGTIEVLRHAVLDDWFAMHNCTEIEIDPPA